MFLRRSAAVLAGAALLGSAGVLGAPAALADESPSPKPKLPSGLYGSADPQYDGVYRQSLALLAQDAVGVVPAKKAVNWLAQQQCDGGSFTAYRPDPGEPCGSGSGEDAADTNATGAAVQALARLGGHGKTVAASVTWLKSVQNKDGGWGYNPGGDSDANSTALVVGALAAAGEKPGEVVSRTGDRTPYDALRALQLGCDADAGERGAFAYMPEKGELAANDAATVAAALAAHGSGFASVAADRPAAAEDGDATEVAAPSCGEDDTYAQKDSAKAAAAYLSGALKENKGFLPSVTPGAQDQPDHGSTALAALALAGIGEPGAAARPLGWLEKNIKGWDGVAGNPAALAQLVLAVHASGGDATDFADTDLVKRLNATGPEPEKSEPEDAGADEAEEDDGGSNLVLWIVGVALVAGIGLGLLMSMRKGGKNS
ncbi:hypothetical protein MTQ01_08915 [Streptomyces sp. XM4193]|uniref:prenyltransferase/squalene oxidase repeat-containing protein n=1 Tax=Streptomyces sp. XM4193 TaxID=2929782 RepID=UPI001FF80D3F|nr:prenyltransferase/squalene oxidase repeat-containing protein [Streptomyces sp. XM4193]MCK1796123.1 hypothetical protein [Streptomyces sp. XM4193]